MSAEQRLKALGITLPAGSAPAANYANAVRTGHLLFIAGKAPLPAIDLVAAMRSELGSLDRVARVVEIQGFLNATPEFEDHAKVLNGCSDLLVEIFAERGVHARSVLGASSLRGGLPVILKGIVEVVQ